MLADEVASRFQLPGDIESVAPFRGGHINDSFLVTVSSRITGASAASQPARANFLLQRINNAIFRDPPALMENILRVTNHIRARLLNSAAADVRRAVLNVIPARDDLPYARDAVRGWWRMYGFIENSRWRESAERPADVSSAGRAFGAFQRALADYDGPRLTETIPDFHHTPRRYDAFELAANSDLARRAADCSAEIDFARARRDFAGVLLDLLAHREIPERIVHNDAKLSNVLFDAATDDVLCVVDLDTVMPGLSLFDFGDMMRSMICPAAEDERDLGRVCIRLDMFESLARGYLSEAGAFLTPSEQSHLVTAGLLITYEQGLRFLADHLNGDVYYKTARPGQNLDRTRVQFALVAAMEREASTLRDIAHRAAG